MHYFYFCASPCKHGRNENIFFQRCSITSTFKLFQNILTDRQISYLWVTTHERIKFRINFNSWYSFYFGVLHPVARTLSRLFKELSLLRVLCQGYLKNCPSQQLFKVFIYYLFIKIYKI
jgi:hypothetical protein